jgi:hypothetical protein
MTRSDIEDFTIAQLLAEVARRCAAADRRACWYCGQHARAHTCKHAESVPFHGWRVEPPAPYVDGYGNHGWKTTATLAKPKREVFGVGLCRDVADSLCFARIVEINRTI